MEQLFALGSLMASMAQGWMLGAYITGLTGDAHQHGFFGLDLANATRALHHAGGRVAFDQNRRELFDKAAHWCRLALPPMAFALLLVSIATHW